MIPQGNGRDPRSTLLITQSCWLDFMLCPYIPVADLQDEIESQGTGSVP